MFEKAQPQSIGASARYEDRADAQASRGDRVVAPDSPEREGGALRMIEWNDLTSRLNAARDLRMLLRSDSQSANEGDAGRGAGSIADAAARYFRTREEGERDVNPVALEQRKGSSGNVTGDEEMTCEGFQHRERAATGDARED